MKESQLTLFIIIVIIVMTLLIISIILFFNISQKRILAEKEKRHQQKMKFQKQLLAKNIETQEKERSRIARELHDDLSSKLNVVNLNVELLKLRGQNGDNAEILDMISQALTESIERSRKISHELMPPILEKFGLCEAIIDLARGINTSDQLLMQVNGKEILDNISGQNKLHIFRIVQELCNNTLKHAGADAITLDCVSKDGSVVITYSDDGIGISNGVKENGLGMMNIESRIQILHAHLEKIPSEQGVCFELIVPNEQKNNSSG
ncbi:sensor histidine kinase [Portibacter marinus]|uniref:sensor histidine kinase n=1 Tax=Portibacter marinus TaxID=2898660 RepID=UPI001F1D14D7|nr:histidine kinase [Portibacter marinus]